MAVCNGGCGQQHSEVGSRLQAAITTAAAVAAAVDCIAAAAAEKPQVSVVQAHALHCQLVSGYTPRTSTTPFTVFRIMVCLDTC